MQSDETDFREFVAARGSALARTAYLLTGDRGHAEDLVQTALARCWPRWSRVRSAGSTEAYVRRTMINTWYSWWRRSWRGELPSSDAIPDRAGPDMYAVADERSDLRAALADLPKRQRAVVVLRYYDDLTEAQVAALLDCSVGTVKSQASKGLRRLRVGELLAEATGTPTTAKCKDLP